MKSILDTAPCGYITFDDRGLIITVNETLCNLLGYKKEGLQSEKFESILDIAGRIFFQTHFFPLLKMQNKAEEVFLNLVTYKNKKLPVLANASRAETDDGVINTCVFIPVHNRRKFEDELIAAKKLAEKSLRENDALIRATRQADDHARELEKKNKVLYHLNNESIQIGNILNHEIKECIRKIVIFSKLSKEDSSEDYNEKIISTAGRLKQINNAVNEILNLNSREIGFEKCSLKELIRKAHSKLPDGELLSINYESQPPSELEVIPNQIEMLFFHLFQNSVKYRSQEKVKISIDCVVYGKNAFTYNEDKYHYAEVLQLILTDNSEGFDDQYSDYVFNMLKTLGGDKDGIGTGLALCRKVVENHNGEISINSKPGEGTIVKIILPVRQELKTTIDEKPNASYGKSLG